MMFLSLCLSRNNSNTCDCCCWRAGDRHCAPGIRHRIHKRDRQCSAWRRAPPVRVNDLPAMLRALNVTALQRAPNVNAHLCVCRPNTDRRALLEVTVYGADTCDRVLRESPSSPVAIFMAAARDNLQAALASQVVGATFTVARLTRDSVGPKWTLDLTVAVPATTAALVEAAIKKVRCSHTASGP